jgi:folate-binding protein YgfZ
MKHILLNYVVIRISGNAEKLLTGLTANTLDARQNAFVNLHGRIIATFFQQKEGEDVLIAVPNAQKDTLLAHLDRYAKLNRSQLITTDLNVYMDMETKAVLFSKETFPAVPDDEARLWRLENNLPLQGIDYQADEFLLNVHEHDYTSYTKGCFLGQEPIAKVHNRSKPSKKLIATYADELSAEDQAKMTSKITDPANGRTKGFVFVKNT